MSQEKQTKIKIKVKLDGLASATQYLSIRTSELKQNFENLKIEMAKHSSQSDLVDPVVLEARETQLRELRMRLLDLKKLIVKKSVWRTKLQSLKKIGNLDDLISTADDFRLNHKILQHRNSQISLEELNIDIYGIGLLQPKPPCTEPDKSSRICGVPLSPEFTSHKNCRYTTPMVWAASSRDACEIWFPPLPHCALRPSVERPLYDISLDAIVIVPPAEYC